MIRRYRDRILIATGLLGWMSFGALGCSDGQDQPLQPNLIFISIDTLRPDHLGCYGYSRETSPTIDALAARGVVFDKAFAQASWTIPSHMSMFTSMYPHTHQVDRQAASLPESIPTVTGALREGGYSTSGFASWLFLSERFGFGRGFDRYEVLKATRDPENPRLRISPDAGTLVELVSGSFVSEGTPGLDKESPFFLFLHFFDPHLDYEPPLADAQLFDPQIENTDLGSYVFLQDYVKGTNRNMEPIPADACEEVRALYDGEIRHTDRQLGILLAEMELAGLLENTIIVLTSDHGEEFFEHGSMEGHQWTLYDEVLHVPLIVVFPDGRDAGRRIDTLVQSIDLAPTMLDFAGVPQPEVFQGRSLVRLLDGTETWDETSFSQIRRYNEKWALRTRTHKLIYTGDTKVNRFKLPVVAGFELYDLTVDPGETVNTYVESDSTSTILAARLQQWIGERAEALPTDVPSISEEERERLRSVGYIGN